VIADVISAVEDAADIDADLTVCLWSAKPRRTSAEKLLALIEQRFGLIEQDYEF
jgi:hypothetical protein